jgi:hypothetical protein
MIADLRRLALEVLAVLFQEVAPGQDAWPDFFTPGLLQPPVRHRAQVGVERLVRDGAPAADGDVVGGDVGVVGLAGPDGAVEGAGLVSFW